MESENSQFSTQRSDLVIIQSVWNDMKKQNKQTDKIQKNCGNVFKMLQETYLQSYLKNDAQVHRGQKLL